MKYSPAAGALLCACLIALVGCSGPAADNPAVGDDTPSAPTVMTPTPEDGDNTAAGDDEDELSSNIAELSSAMGSLGGYVSADCMAVGGLVGNVSMMMVAASVGEETVTQDDIDGVFGGLQQMPPELQGAFDTVQQAVTGAVGRPYADLMEVFDNPDVEYAMDEFGDYADANCTG